MPVVSHQYFARPQADGRVYARFEYELDTGSVRVVGPKLVLGNIDLEAAAIAQIPVVEAQVIQEELEQWSYLVATGSLDALAVNPVHPSTDTPAVRRRRFLRWFFRRVARLDDIKVVRRQLYSVWLWLKNDSGYSAQEIADYLDVSIAKLAVWDGRMQAIHDNLAFIDSDQGEEVE
jgi:hypothetical protein